jgi:hypothetical protein
MTIKTTGTLSLLEIQTEFGGTTPIGLNEYYKGGGTVPGTTATGPGGIPISTSGEIDIAMFYGTNATAPAGSVDYLFPGVFSFVVPAGYTSLNVTTVGGGGGGGGHQGGGDGHMGGIGGSGGYRTTNISATPGQTLTVVVGTGGMQAYSSGQASTYLFYNGDHGGTSMISGYQETVSTGGWGGGRSGDGDHGDKGTLEDWGIDGYQPWRFSGNGRAGVPNGFDFWSTPVDQRRGNDYSARSGMTCPTGYALAGTAGIGGEGCDSWNGGGIFQPQSGTAGRVTIRWGMSYAPTSDTAEYKGSIWGALGSVALSDMSLYDASVRMDKTVANPATIYAYGGWEESYIYPYGSARTIITWSASCAYDPLITFSFGDIHAVSTVIIAHNVPGYTVIPVTITCTVQETPVGSHAYTVSTVISTVTNLVTNQVQPDPYGGGQSG